jgi:hypothetical protein
LNCRDSGNYIKEKKPNNLPIEQIAGTSTKENIAGTSSNKESPQSLPMNNKKGEEKDFTIEGEKKPIRNHT